MVINNFIFTFLLIISTFLSQKTVIYGQDMDSCFVSEIWKSISIDSLSTDIPELLENDLEVKYLKINKAVCFKDIKKILSLSNLKHLSVIGPTSIPNNVIFELINNNKNLNFLTLNNLGLTSLPINYSQFSNLTFIDLTNNNIQFFPDDFLELENLQYLDLDSNNLRKIPVQIFHLTSLEGLFLEDNPNLDLKYFFNNLPKMQALKMLLLDNCSINTFNIDLKLNKNLKTLHISRNNGQNISFQNISHLEILKLIDNNIEKIPSDISKMSCLKKLDLADNNITYLPNEISKLSNSLEILVIYGNPISDKEKERIMKLLPETYIVFEKPLNIYK